jgi:hypothetical protein
LIIDSLKTKRLRIEKRSRENDFVSTEEVQAAGKKCITFKVSFHPKSFFRQLQQQIISGNGADSDHQYFHHNLSVLQ